MYKSAHNYEKKLERMSCVKNDIILQLVKYRVANNCDKMTITQASQHF